MGHVHTTMGTAHCTGRSAKDHDSVICHDFDAPENATSSQHGTGAGSGNSATEEPYILFLGSRFPVIDPNPGYVCARCDRADPVARIVEGGAPVSGKRRERITVKVCAASEGSQHEDVEVSWDVRGLSVGQDDFIAIYNSTDGTQLLGDYVASLMAETPCGSVRFAAPQEDGFYLARYVHEDGRGSSVEKEWSASPKTVLNLPGMWGAGAMCGVGAGRA